MDIQKIEQYKSAFDAIVEIVKDEDGNDIEVWYARKLQTVLGYARWVNFGADENRKSPKWNIWNIMEIGQHP